MKQQHIHFIGICGVAMSALAIAFKKQGWRVTGSDVGFYPPVSTHLKEADIDFYPGWHPEKMVASGDPDLVVVGNVASSTNPEWLHVKKENLNYKSYPEIIKEFFVKKNSIVVAGTYGKSTSTCLITWILKENNFDPSYMFGGIALNEVSDSEHPPRPPQGGNAESPLEGGSRGMLSAQITNSAWSVLEGDEYKASRWDNGAKFFYYSPNHLLLTSVVWDHADVYPTETSYIEAFNKLVAMIPKNGLRIISEKALPIIRPTSPSPVSGHPPQGGNHDKSPLEGGSRGMFVTYGKTAGNDYFYTNVKETKNGLTFDIKYKDQTFAITSQCLGEYMADNITGCFALCHKIGLAPEKIIASIKTFSGMKRRLEKRFEGKVTVFDDIAHSPTKAQAVLASLYNIYKCHPERNEGSKRLVDLDSSRHPDSVGTQNDNRIFAVFEPNAGNRRPQARTWYAHAFEKADGVIIPHLTKIKIDEQDEDKPFEGDELAKIIGQTHPHVVYEPDDNLLVSTLIEKTKPGDVIIFLGSHGFRGMIETLVQKLK